METTNVAEICAQISKETKNGDLKKLAKTLKTQHDLAVELWKTEEIAPRKLAVLVFDKKELTDAFLTSLFEDMSIHERSERERLADWLMANQLMKNKACVELIGGWQDAPNEMQRRVFWYHQARLRWTGQEPPPNTSELMELLEEKLEHERPTVQWAMNFTAAQIGIHDPEYREQCIALGERLELFKDEKPSRGCTPNYLPEFIRIETEKLEKKANG